MRLGKQLGIESDKINELCSKYGEDYPRATHDMLTQWRKDQEYDQIAYVSLYKALTNQTVGLNNIAKVLQSD